MGWWLGFGIWGSSFPTSQKLVTITASLGSTRLSLLAFRHPLAPPLSFPFPRARGIRGLFKDGEIYSKFRQRKEAPIQNLCSRYWRCAASYRQVRKVVLEGSDMMPFYTTNTQTFK